ncbi:hypothetical protein K435DRAFT_791175 [Dendrothele bispora CBS 962.96]|uniref:C2H2-type domain-containing protein n=1 Tax=Dendrothele bispora (strain CBS 962.96) TaxID=1314807 RepID=A0A4S8MMJ2_DENBC|nr:hypothetical protein K435DRAFT_791175 [Dendrothele bispora CBS 962.96]
MDFEPLGFHSYCALCDDYFQDHFTRARHVENSPNHPQCSLCGCQFLNKNLLRNHKVMAPHHHYCRVCDKDFYSSGGLQVHLDTIHLDNDNDEHIEDEEYERREKELLPEGWEDERALELYPDGNYEDSYKEEILKDVEDHFAATTGNSTTSSILRTWIISDTEEDDEFFYGWEGDEVVKLEITDKFTCPMCLRRIQKHEYTETCHICNEYGEVCGLRRVYVSENH